MGALPLGAHLQDKAGVEELETNLGSYRDFGRPGLSG